MKRGLLLFLMMLWLQATSLVNADEADTVVKRWYTSEQVAQGKELFAKHCAECHGPTAASTPQWRKPDQEGNYPPPPLNGTAHTWHHPLPLLRRILQEGGAKIGGKMPPFQDTLTAAEIDAVIAWFQSLWPDEIYTRWSGAGTPKILQLDFLKNPGSDKQ